MSVQAVMIWLQMGGYAAYVWPAYGVAAVVLGFMTIASLGRYRASRRLLERLQAERRPERREASE